MDYSNDCNDRPGLLQGLVKAILLLFVGLFLVLGLVGLLLPIIPGILFLALAFWLMTKVSGRSTYHLQNHYLWLRGKRAWRSLFGRDRF